MANPAQDAASRDAIAFYTDRPTIPDIKARRSTNGDESHFREQNAGGLVILRTNAFNLSVGGAQAARYSTMIQATSYLIQ